MEYPMQLKSSYLSADSRNNDLLLLAHVQHAKCDDVAKVESWMKPVTNQNEGQSQAGASTS
jgi:hypothetical protein